MVLAQILGYLERHRLGLYRGYIGIMEKKMETTIGFRVGVILGQWKRKCKLQ